MIHKLRLIWHVIVNGGPGAIGDVHMVELPKWFMYLWFAGIMIWFHTPVVMLRKTYDDLKSKSDNEESYKDFVQKRHEENRRLKSIIDQLDHKLRETDQLHLLREAQKNVEDPNWDFPRYEYASDTARKHSSHWSHPPVRNGAIT